MHLTSLVGLFIGFSLAQCLQYHLERYYGYVHHKVFYLSQVKCLAQCSMDVNCCAFSFIAGVANECHIFRNCSQKEDLNNFDPQRVYYRREVELTSPVPPTTISTTTPLPPTTKPTTKPTTTTTTTTTPLPPVTKPKPIPPVVLPPPPPTPKPTPKPTQAPVPVPPPALIPAPPPPPAPQPPPPPAPVPQPPPAIPFDPIFSTRCKGASKAVIGGASEAFILIDNPWTYCSECLKHVGYYPGQGFNRMYRDSTWNYLVIVRSFENVCDLLVECNKPGNHAELQKHNFYLNGKLQGGKNFVLRITWEGGKWLTTNDLKKGVDVIAQTIECK